MPALVEQPPPLRFQGHQGLARRLVLATLTGKPIRVSGIRPDSHADTGLAVHETSLIRLLDSVTNGSQIEFSYTGTTFIYKPGLILGTAEGYGAGRGGTIRHEVPADCTRGVSYFLIPLCMLAPFAKKPVNVLFTGPGVITSATDTGDVSVDTVRTAILPLYAQFGVQLNLELRILKRSCAGYGGKGGAGEVQLVFGHQVLLPKTIHFLTPGKIRRVRGVAYSTGLGGANNARMIEAARGVLNAFAADTYIFSDVSSAPTLPDARTPQGKRRVGVGFGLSLVAESTTNCLFSADAASPAAGGVPAEAIGSRAAYALLDAVNQGGCASALGAQTILTLMAAGSQDVGRVRLGRGVVGAAEFVGLARDVAAFGGPSWALREAEAGAESDEDDEEEEDDEENLDEDEDDLDDDSQLDDDDVDSEPDPAAEAAAGPDVVVSVVGFGVGNVGRKIA